MLALRNSYPLSSIPTDVFQGISPHNYLLHYRAVNHNNVGSVSSHELKKSQFSKPIILTKTHNSVTIVTSMNLPLAE